MFKQIVVHGRVQGVGFRMTTKQLAETYNIKGQVQNKENGTVEIIASGEEKDMDAFIQKIRNNPSPAARVEQTDITDLDGASSFKDFRVV